MTVSCAKNSDFICLKDELLTAMRRIFGSDQRRINHALAVLSYAERIASEIPGTDIAVVTAAAILHDIGIHEAERIYNSAAGNYQEITGPPIAEKIMRELKMPEETVRHVSRIVGSHHSAGDIDTTEFRIIWDADWLVNIPDEHPDMSPHKLEALIRRVFKTVSGKRLALDTLLPH